MMKNANAKGKGGKDVETTRGNARGCRDMRSNIRTTGKSNSASSSSVSSSTVQMRSKSNSASSSSSSSSTAQMQRGFPRSTDQAGRMQEQIQKLKAENSKLSSELTQRDEQSSELEAYNAELEQKKNDLDKECRELSRSKVEEHLKKELIVSQESERENFIQTLELYSLLEKSKLAQREETNSELEVSNDDLEKEIIDLGKEYKLIRSKLEDHLKKKHKGQQGRECENFDQDKEEVFGELEQYFTRLNVAIKDVESECDLLREVNVIAFELLRYRKQVKKSDDGASGDGGNSGGDGENSIEECDKIGNVADTLFSSKEDIVQATMGVDLSACNTENFVGDCLAIYRDNNSANNLATK